jgi:ring-1,2-phenylacetyl-CoA epoxidase subunit PaaE
MDGDGFVTLRVGDVTRDTDDSVVLTFDASLPFVHGQHLTLRRAFDGVELRRSYSICSPVGGALRVAIRQVPDGVFSQWAATALAPGDGVEVLAPAGHFTHALDPGAARRYTFLAAGSGITPIFSILATVLSAEPRSTASLWYLNRSASSTMLLDELHDLRDRHLGRLQLTFAFTREMSESDLLSGRPDRQRFDRLIEAGIIDTDVDHAFVCGPVELITLATEAMTAAGLAAERIHREIFTTNQVGTVTLAPQQITETSVAIAHGTATLHGRATAFEVYEGDSVLDAVQRVRPDAPFSCRSGVCSTCQAVMRSGEVEMAVNYGLSPDELDRGYVLTCQSHPLTPTLHVDYDA